MESVSSLLSIYGMPADPVLCIQREPFNPQHLVEVGEEFGYLGFADCRPVTVPLTGGHAGRNLASIAPR